MKGGPNLTLKDAFRSEGCHNLIRSTLTSFSSNVGLPTWKTNQGQYPNLVDAVFIGGKKLSRDQHETMFRIGVKRSSCNVSGVMGGQLSCSRVIMLLGS